jgi:hypothetical protein
MMLARLVAGHQVDLEEAHRMAYALAYGLVQNTYHL